MASEAREADGSLHNAESVPGKPSLSPVSGMPDQANSSKHKSWRRFEGLFLVIQLVLSVGVVVSLLAPPLFFLFRLLSIRFSRACICAVFGAWLSAYPFVLERLKGCRVFFSGSALPPKERALIIVNHRTEVDWMFLWSLAYRKGSVGHLRFALKSTVRNVPIFGWAFQCLEFLLLDRRWDLDKLNIEQWVSSFKNSKEPLWLVIFPEGTDYSEAKKLQSQEYAEAHGLPKLDKVLLPRTKGFTSCFMPLRDTLDAVYDVTIGYKPRDPCIPDLFFGVPPTEVHLHTRRLAPSELPEKEKDLEVWLYDTFQLKDRLLTEFANKGKFTEATVKDPLVTLPCVMSFVGFLCLVGVCFWLVASSKVFRAYMVISMVALASSTYLKWKPKPIF